MVSDFLGVEGSNLNLLTFVGIVNFQSQLGPPVQPAVVCLHSEYCTKETINKFRRLREPTLFHRGADERGHWPGTRVSVTAMWGYVLLSSAQSYLMGKNS